MGLVLAKTDITVRNSVIKVAAQLEKLGERTLLELGYAIEAEMPWQRIDQVANAINAKH